MVEFSKVNIKEIEDEYGDEEEAGEEVESAPPQKVGEEREIGSNGLRKKLIKKGVNWETPNFGDEVTIHYVGTSCEDGNIFASTKTSNEPVTLKLGDGNIARGLDNGIVTMKKGEIASFTLPPELANGGSESISVPPNSAVQFEVELLSWIRVFDICKDGGIIKRIVESGEQIGPPGELDEVCVSYKAMLLDGTILAETPEEGVEFYVKDGHFCPGFTRALKTMKRGERANLVIQPQYAFGQSGNNSSNELPIIPPDSTLSIFIKLLSIKPVIDVTGDLKVKKKILKEGEGTVIANEGANVTIRYTATLEDGTVFDRKGFDGEPPLQFITDEEEVVAGLDRAVATMKKSELALITISPEYGFGSNEVKTDHSLVKPSSTLLYEVEMLNFIREKAPWEMSNPERIEAASRKKEEGNQLFKIGKFERAAKKYEKAVDYVSQDTRNAVDDEKIVKPLRLSCWSNGAACCLKLNNFKEAIDLCSKILDVEFCNVKALYRRAQAYIGVADFLSAEFDVKKALEVDPNNKEVKQLQKNLKQLQEKSDKRDAKLYRAMFPSRSTDGCIAQKRLKIAGDEDIAAAETNK